MGGDEEGRRGVHSPRQHCTGVCVVARSAQRTHPEPLQIIPARGLIIACTGSHRGGSGKCQECEGWVGAGQRNKIDVARTQPRQHHGDGRSRLRLRASASTAAKGQHSCAAVQGRVSCVATATLSTPPPRPPPPATPWAPLIARVGDHQYSTQSQRRPRLRVQNGGVWSVASGDWRTSAAAPGARPAQRQTCPGSAHRPPSPPFPLTAATKKGHRPLRASCGPGCHGRGAQEQTGVWGNFLVCTQPTNGMIAHAVD